MASLQERIAAARQKAQQSANLIRWEPKEAGEMLVGEYLDTLEYESKRRNFVPRFVRLKVVEGAAPVGHFVRGKVAVTPQAGDIVEVPSHGFLDYYRENQDWEPGDILLFMYGGKHDWDEGPTDDSKAHSWQVERV